MTILAVCLLIAGLAFVIGGLYHIMHEKNGPDGSEKYDFDRRAGSAFAMMFFGGLLAASGAIIGIIQIIKHLRHLIH